MSSEHNVLGYGKGEGIMLLLGTRMLGTWTLDTYHMVLIAADMTLETLEDHQLAIEIINIALVPSSHNRWKRGSKGSLSNIHPEQQRRSVRCDPWGDSASRAGAAGRGVTICPAARSESCSLPQW